MPKPFDGANKHLFENRPIDWLRFARLPLPRSPKDVTVVDADLSTVMTLSADKLVRVGNVPGIGTYLAHIEFQSGPDPDLDLRMLLYNAAIRRRHRLPVLSVVFLLRPKAHSPGVTGGVSDQLDAIAKLDFGYHVVPVWKLPPEAVLRAGVGVLPLAPITAVRKEDLPALIGAVKRRIHAEVPGQQGKEFLLAMRVLMGLKYQESLTEKLMQTIAEMTDSVEWQKIHRKGKAEGKAEGIIEGERRTLIRLGTAKFGRPSAAVLKRLSRAADAGNLSRLSERLLTASAWKDLFGG
jgi:predicted transposase YdaD